MRATTSVTSDAPVVRTIALTRRFGSLLAVDALDLTIATGTIFGLLGSNGAGKTTVIRMLTTLLPPTSGTAEVAGYDIVRDAARVRRHIGYVPQLLSADGALTGYENLLLSARLYDVPRAEQKPRITEALAFMGLDAAAHTLPRTYSAGIGRRLGVAGRGACGRPVGRLSGDLLLPYRSRPSRLTGSRVAGSRHAPR